jgi:hypothetical protein
MGRRAMHVGVLVGKPKEKRPLEILMRRWEDNTGTD